MPNVAKRLNIRYAHYITDNIISLRYSYSYEVITEWTVYLHYRNQVIWLQVTLND